MVWFGSCGSVSLVIVATLPLPFFRIIEMLLLNRKVMLRLRVFLV